MNTIPCVMEVYDYHEFKEAQDHFNIINKEIKVKEIDFDGFTYFGIIYTGNLKSPENRKVINKTKRFCKISRGD